MELFEINEETLLPKRGSKQEFCTCCGQPIIDYPVTLTHRNLKWLLALGYLSHMKGGVDQYVSYRDVHALIAKKFVGKSGKPMVVSSYSVMSLKPWEFIESKTLIESADKRKYVSVGEWRLTPAGLNFVNNALSVPETAYFRHDGCYFTERSVCASELKLVNFQELITYFKSF
jgi:hypothetical protein